MYSCFGEKDGNTLEVCGNHRVSCLTLPQSTLDTGKEFKVCRTTQDLNHLLHGDISDLIKRDRDGTVTFVFITS